MPLTFAPRMLIRSSCLTIALLLAASPLLLAQKTEISIDLSKPGPTINRNLFGQFAEHLGHGIYEGIWVGTDSAIPNTRGIRRKPPSGSNTSLLRNRPHSLRSVPQTGIPPPIPSPSSASATKAGTAAAT